MTSILKRNRKEGTKRQRPCKDGGDTRVTQLQAKEGLEPQRKSKELF
jgi:hypothetical protein